MFLNHDLRGDRLPRKVRSLADDDGPGQTLGEGPGPQTLRLAAFLYRHQIQATFFVVGRHAREMPEALGALRDMGHLIANHSFNHPNLVELAEAGGDLVGEIAQTDAIIKPYLDGNVVLFRPPYGAWRREGAATSVVAQVLNRSVQMANHLGPVQWDIDAGDWLF